MKLKESGEKKQVILMVSILNDIPPVCLIYFKSATFVSTEEPDFYNMPQIHLKNDNKAMNFCKENKDCDQLSTICQSSLESLEPFSFRSSEQPDQMNSSIRDVEQNPPKHARKVREHEKQHKNKSSTSSMVLKLYFNDARDIEQNLICNDVCFNDDNQSEISEVSFLAI